MATQAQIAAVQQLYIGYLGRAADKAGLDFWTNAVATGVSTLESVATGFTLSNEYKAAFGGLTNDALVEKVYTSVLGRASDTAGKAFWVDALAKGTVTADKLVATFIGALGAPDQTIINNKTFVAQTYTDTAGANYNGAAGAAVIVKVDGTAASVATAIGSISNGTLPGLVPGQALIAKVAAVQAEITALEKATATTNAAYDADKNGSVTKVEAENAALAANDARFLAGTGVSAKTTAVLTDEAATAAKTLSDASALVDASGAAAVAAKSAYINAVAAQKALVGTTDPAAAQTKAVADAKTAMTAVDSSLKAAGAVTTYAKLNVAFGGTVAAPVIGTSAQLKDALNSLNGTPAKAALIAELQKLPVFGQAAIDSVAKEASIIAANSAVTNAEKGTGITAYVDAAKVSATASDLVTKATTADAAIAAAKVVVDKFAALDTKATLATTELATFQTANADKILLKDLTANKAVAINTATAAKSDVFYFTKVATTDDFSIGSTAANTFGVGDSIVLGSAYTGNAGALTTGNHSALEVFFVQNATGTQVVIETKAVGSATTVVDASGNVTASPDAAVINLVGVTADHLSFANGAISYV